MGRHYQHSRKRRMFVETGRDQGGDMLAYGLNTTIAV